MLMINTDQELLKELVIKTITTRWKYILEDSLKEKDLVNLLIYTGDYPKYRRSAFCEEYFVEFEGCAGYGLCKRCTIDPYICNQSGKKGLYRELINRIIYCDLPYSYLYGIKLIQDIIVHLKRMIL